MFTIDTVVDTAVKTQKQALSFVQDANFKKEAEALVDAQATYAKTVLNTTLDLTKYAVEQFGKFDVKNFDISKMFGQVKAK
jgi:hypothetical protein